MIDKIKKVIPAEILEQVETALKVANIELGVTNDGSYVPAGVHDPLKAELETQKALVITLQGKITKLSTLETDNGVLKQELLDAKTESDAAIITAKADAEKTVNNAYVKTELQTELLAEGADPKNVDLLMGEFEIDKMTLTDKKKILGIKELIAPVKEKRGTLFVKVSVEGVPPVGGLPPGDNSVNPFDKKTFNMTKQAELLKKDPAEAKRLAAAVGRPLNI